MGKKNNLIGQKFDRLKVIEEVQRRYSKGGKSIRRWLCECECGNKNIIVDGQLLTNKNTKSCGCLNNDKRRETVKKYLRKYNKYNLVDYDYGVGYLKNNLEFYFDKEDYDKICNYYWTLNDEGYIKARSGDSYVTLHKIITNTDESKNVDHILHDKFKLDNRKSNLRIVTKSQNSQNHILRKDNTSGVTGVYWHKKRKKWIAHICINYKQTELGAFNDFNEAVDIRLEYEKKIFGEYQYKGESELISNGGDSP